MRLVAAVLVDDFVAKGLELLELGRLLVREFAGFFALHVNDLLRRPFRLRQALRVPRLVDRRVPAKFASLDRISTP